MGEEKRRGGETRHTNPSLLPSPLHDAYKHNSYLIHRRDMLSLIKVDIHYVQKTVPLFAVTQHLYVSLMEVNKKSDINDEGM